MSSFKQNWLLHEISQYQMVRDDQIKCDSSLRVATRKECESTRGAAGVQTARVSGVLEFPFMSRDAKML